MSQFTGLLRQITKKASHPNSLLYNIQLERAKQKYLVRGQLGSGADGAVALGAPKTEEPVGEKNISDTQETTRSAAEPTIENSVTESGVATSAKQNSGDQNGQASASSGGANEETGQRP